MSWFNRAKQCFKAIENGDTRKAKSLIASGLDVNSVVQGQTLAYWAVRYQSEDILSALIAAGADIGKTTDAGTPLSAAIFDQSPKIVRTLMEAGAFDREPNAETELLRDAIMWDSADEVFDMLFAAGVDANARDSGGTSALIYALSSKLSHAAKLLVEHGANVNTTDDGDNPLALAAEAGFLDVVDAMLKAGAKVGQKDESGMNALDYARMEGHADVAELLRQAGALETAEIEEKVREAAAKGDIDRAMGVIREGGDVQDALFEACMHGQADMIKPLVKAGADVHKEYAVVHTPLSLAANAATVRALIEVGADPNRPNEDGQSPLFRAAETASPEVIKALLDAGATVARSSPYSRTPLHVAAMHGRHEVVQFLTQAGADVTSQGGGRTPLMEAADYAREGGTETIRALLAAGAPIEEVNSKGHTALMYAVKGSNEVTLTALLAEGARVDVKDPEGQTPYDLLDGIPVPSDADQDEFAAIMEHRDHIREILDRARDTSN